MSNVRGIKMVERQFIISIRKATKDDADALFDLAKEMATSFVPERAAFEIALADIISTD